MAGKWRSHVESIYPSLSIDLPPSYQENRTSSFFLGSRRKAQVAQPLEAAGLRRDCSIHVPS